MRKVNIFSLGIVLLAISTFLSTNQQATQAATSLNLPFVSWSSEDAQTATKNVEMETFDGKLFQAIRGQDKYIYTRSFDGANWSSWEQLAIEAGSNIELEEFNGRLYLAFKGAADKRINIRSFNGTNWSSVFTQSKQIKSDIELEVYNNALYMSVRDLNNRIVTRVKPGPKWDKWSGSSLDARGNVTMEVFNNKIYQTTRDATGRIFFRTKKNDNDWISWRSTNQFTKQNSTLKVYKDELYQAVVNTSGKLSMRTHNGTKWSGWKNYRTAKGLNGMEVYDNHLVQVVRDTDNHIYSRMNNGTGWSPWADDSTVMKSNVSVATFNNRLYQSAVGQDSQIYNRYIEGTISTFDKGTVLMFVSQEDTYYTEYKITLEALLASGYQVDVRSATSSDAAAYSLTGNIDAAGNQVSGSTYSEFTAMYADNFGSSWDSNWNAVNITIPVDGSILDVTDMTNYVALVIPGGTGILDYRFDGSYSAQGSVPALTVEAVAEKLNTLAIDSLTNAKPVLAICHGASLPVLFRVPGTFGNGPDGLGDSLLATQSATGYPEAATATLLSDYGVNFRADDKVTVTSPNGNFDSGLGDFKLITSRDWYSQSVAHATRTLINILETYPTQVQAETNIDVLILHGGAVDTGNCSPANTANDIPCNYGTGSDTPADYTDIVALLNADSTNDNYAFTVSEINLINSTPDLATLNNYDVVIFFKHWSSGVTEQLENDLVAFADSGGGVIGLHHAAYNQDFGGLNKDILVDQLFKVESTLSGFVLPALYNYTLYSTDYGNFISTYGVDLDGSNPTLTEPGDWSTNAPDTSANLSYSYYQNFGVYDELYHNLVFVPGTQFGRGINDITPLFSNAYASAPDSQYHTSGFTQMFDPSLDDSVGRVVYMQAGERKESVNINHRYGQVLRNAVVWAAL